jgi:hypothetical protein
MNREVLSKYDVATVAEAMGELLVEARALRRAAAEDSALRA